MMRNKIFRELDEFSDVLAPTNNHSDNIEYDREIHL